MTKLRLFATLVLLTALVLCTAQARQIAVYPRSGGGPITVYSPDLQNLGFITGPPAPVAVLNTLDGSKYYVLSRSAASTMTIATAPLNGTGRIVNLGEEAQGGAVTYDGRRLIVLTSNVRIFDTVTDTEVVTPIYVGSLPNDVAVSPDSRYAYVVSAGSGTVAQIDLATNYLVTTQTAPPNASAVTVAPNGLVYVSGEGKISIFDGRTLASVGQIAFNGRAGRLSITPDDRYAISPNVIRTGSSVLIFDLVQRTLVASSPIYGPDGNLAAIDTTEVSSNSRAFALSNTSGRIYDITLPAGTSTDFIVPSSGVPNAASGIATSSELPSARNFYFVNSSNLSRLDLSQNVASNLIPLNYPGAVTRLGDTPVGGVYRFLLDSDGAVVAPGSTFLLVARSVDVDGVPVRNAFVNFASASVGVNFITTPSPTTVGSGYATVVVQAPSYEGAFQITISSGSITQTLSLRSGTGSSGGGSGGGVNSALVKIQGDGQLTSTPGAAAQDLIVEARDAAGVPVSGVPVSWSGGTDVFLRSDSFTYTDSNGRARLSVSLSAVIPNGSYITTSVTASTSNATVRFSLVGVPIGSFAPSIVLIKPEGGTGSKIVVKAGVKYPEAIVVGVATVLTNAPIPGVGLSVSTGNTDPAVGPVATCEGGTALTNENGRAACTLIASGKVGTSILIVNIGGGYTFELQIEVQPGDPASIKITQGNGQSGSPGATLPVAMAGIVYDSVGNPLVGVPVSWTISPSGAGTLVLADQVTDFNGRASTQLRLSSTASGTVQVIMRSGDISATFSASVTIPLGALVKVSGDGQGPVITGQPFANPLKVRVLNTSQGPVANVAVGWQVTSGSATLSTASSTTDSAGEAQVTVTAGSTAGAIVVTASVTGLTSVAFNLSSRLPGPVFDSTNFTVLYTNSVGLVAGGYSILTGKGLAPNISGTMYANTLSASLPTTLATVKVQVGPDPQNLAPIYAVSNVNGVESVLFITPFDTPAGAVNVTVRVGEGSTTANSVPVRTYAPAFLETTDNDGRRVPLVIRSDGYLVSAAYPARRGETLIIYAVGLGQTSPQARTNVLGGINQKLNAPLALAFGSTALTVPAYLSRQFISVYEIEITVPDNAELGPAVPLGLQIAPAGLGPFYAQDNLSVPITTP